MNEITQNGLKVKQTKEWIEVNGVRTEIPEWIKKRGNSLQVVNNVIRYNGYYFDYHNREFISSKPSGKKSKRKLDKFSLFALFLRLFKNR